MNTLHYTFTYDTEATEVHETAENALALGRGVCQDYAHIMLSLLRMEGIPARYVVGMTLGEGASHAWVEALCNGYWYGFDPTDNKLVNADYIRVSCGRDSSDCAVIRGNFYGCVTQRQTEKVKLEEKGEGIMIETVASVGLPIDESLMIKKNRLVPENGLSGNEKRISIVTGKCRNISHPK